MKSQLYLIGLYLSVEQKFNPVIGYGVAAFFTGISAFLDPAGGLIFIVIAPCPPYIFWMIGNMSLILLGNIAGFRVIAAYLFTFMSAPPPSS